MPLGALIDHAPQLPCRDAAALVTHHQAPAAGAAGGGVEVVAGASLEGGVGAPGAEPGVADRGAVGRRRSRAPAVPSAMTARHDQAHRRCGARWRSRLACVLGSFQPADQRSNPNSGRSGRGAAARAGRRGSWCGGGGGRGRSRGGGGDGGTGAGAGAGAATAGDAVEGGLSLARRARRRRRPRRVGPAAWRAGGALAARRSARARRAGRRGRARDAASGASPMSGSSGGGSGRRIRLGRPTNKARQPSTPRASLATLCQRMRDRLPIAPYNPGGLRAPRAVRPGPL